MPDMKKISESETVYLKKIYKFCFDHFLIKRTVFALIEKTLLKIKNLWFPAKFGFLSLFNKFSITEIQLQLMRKSLQV